MEKVLNRCREIVQFKKVNPEAGKEGEKMDKRCKSCKHWVITNTAMRDYCTLLPDKESMEFLYCSPVERKLARLAERIGIKSCKYFEPRK